MSNIVLYSLGSYAKNIRFILPFSLAFVVAFLIPIFAAFPTYNNLGAIFLRTSSVFLNLNILSTAVIVIAVFFSLLFLSFATVAINVICKHSRTHTRITREVLDGLEKYTGKVFAVLVLWTLVLLAANVLFFGTGYSALATAIVGLVTAPLFFYAPSSIVIDDAKSVRAMRASVRFVTKRASYFALWIVVAIVLLSLVDYVFIAVGGTIASRYASLVFDSLFVLPFLTVLQSELYINRFKLLRR